MSSRDAAAEKTITRAKASNQYRSITSPERRAVWLHQEHGISQVRAAQEEGISRGALQRALVAIRENRETRKVGRPQLLNKDDESFLKAKILQRSSNLNAMTITEIQEEASILKSRNSSPTTRSSPEKSNPSRSFVYGLVKRSPELTMKRARIIESDRSKFVTPTTIGNFFDKLEALFEEGKYSPGMIANFDETMIQCTATSLVLVGHAEKDEHFITQQTEMPHITLGVCVFADGSSAPHLVIYPLKKLPPEVSEELVATYSNYVFSGQPSGWISSEILGNYLTKQVIPHFVAQRARPGASKRGLLLLDGHTSRINGELWQTFKDNHIDVMTFVSHASHILQPLDLCVFAAFKSKLRGGMSALKTLSLGQKRGAVMKRAFDSLYHALSPVNIQNGFSRAGIWPLNREEPLSHSGINRHPDTPPVTIRKRRTIIALDEDTLTSDEIIAKMHENQNQEKRPRGRPKQTGRKSAKRTTTATPYDDETAEFETDTTDEE